MAIKIATETYNKVIKSFTRIIWITVAGLLALLLIAKFLLLFVLFGVSFRSLLSAFGILFCFYLLFLVEGLLVAALKVKDHDSDAIDQFLKQRSVDSHNNVIPVYKIFAGNFHGFATGRQILVIVMVVTMAFLNKSVYLPGETRLAINALLQTESGSTQILIDFLNGAVFAFMTATLLPAWFSQLLPQFLADKQAISFILLPGARLVVRVAMVLDQIQLGQPAKAMLSLLNRSSNPGALEHIALGKQTYYEASLHFYGRAKKHHEICCILGNPTTVKEIITYVFKVRKSEYFYHKFQLSAPVQGEIRVKIELPDSVFGQVELREAYKANFYTYWVIVKLSDPLPRDEVDTDEVVLNIEYETEAYTDDVGIIQRTEFTSVLPTENARVSIQLQDGQRLLKKPEVRIVDEVSMTHAVVPDNHGVNNWEISCTENNKTEIYFRHPTVATVYQIEFQTMEQMSGSKV